MIWKGGTRGDEVRCLGLRLSQRVSWGGGGFWLETWTMKPYPAPAGRAFQAERRTSANVSLWGKKELSGFKICEEGWGRLSSGRWEADGKVRSERGGDGIWVREMLLCWLESWRKRTMSSRMGTASRRWKRPENSSSPRAFQKECSPTNTYFITRWDALQTSV